MTNSVNKSEEYLPIKTKDGSLSLFSKVFNENFHCILGAKTEAEDKFIEPSQILLKSGEIAVLDVCFGLGYNSACLIDKLIKKKHIYLNWYGLEQDKAPLKIALSDDNFKEHFSKEVISILESIDSKGNWNYRNNKGVIYWGDARDTIKELPASQKFDLIYLDAFSPNKCPELWTEEFLHELAKKLSPKGKLLTYSSSAAVRATLRRSGLIIKNISPKKSQKSKWSFGTAAINVHSLTTSKDNLNQFSKLSEMEEQHLLTRAAIPYRDESGQSSRKEIIERRVQEQALSKLTSTSAWKKRWLGNNYK